MASPIHAEAQRPAAVVRPLTSCRSDSGDVRIAADFTCDVRKDRIDHDIIVLADDARQRSAQTHQHIGAETGGAALFFTLYADHAAEKHGKRQP